MVDKKREAFFMKGRSVFFMKGNKKKLKVAFTTTHLALDPR